MSVSSLTQLFIDYFSQAQPEIIKEQEILEEVVFKSPFVTAEDIFEDVLPSVNSNEFYSVSYIGSQGHGKTTSAAELATLAEDAGYLIVYGKAEDILIDLQGWINQVKIKIKQHETGKVCFVLDDMSYSTGSISAKAASKFKHFVGDIRHVFEEKDSNGKIIFKPKIFMIYISHRYHSLPPMLRNSPTWLFVSAQPEDKSDAMKLVPRLTAERNKLETICSFISTVTNDGPKQKDLEFIYGGNKTVFRWGDDADAGDGRLLMLVHHGELKIYNAKKKQHDIDLEDYRIEYIPLSPPTEEELEKQKKDKEQVFKLKALEITEKMNKKPIDIKTEFE